METNIGQKLNQVRQEQSLSLEEVARATHMRAHYLQALEEGAYDRIPSMAQARGFLRAYAEFLNLDPGPLLSAMDGQSHTPVPPAANSSDSEKSESPAATEQAAVVFRKIGEDLRQQREVLSLSVEDVLHHTHLRKRYVEALEAGDIANLPSTVQGRGMLKNYADFLGMDTDSLLLRFAEGLQAGLAARQAEHQEKPAEAVSASPRPRHTLRPRLRRIVSSDFLLGSALAVFLLGFIVWGAVRIFSLQTAAAPSPTAPSIAEVLLAPPTEDIPTLTSTSAVSNPNRGVTEQAAPVVEATQEPLETSESQPEHLTEEEGPVQIYLTVHQRSWLRVTVDGKVAFEGRALPGSAYSYAGKDQIEILTGNAAGIQVFFNEEDHGLMGGFGQVVDRVYTPQGMLLPTPTPTLTPTPTMQATQTGAVTPGTPTGSPPPPLP